MPRLRNTATGAVVNVSDDLAERLGAGWEDAAAPAPEAKPAAKRSPGKRSSSNSK